MKKIILYILFLLIPAINNARVAGFYIAENPVVGAHTGLALPIKGVEKGFNDHAVKRENIIHAAEYVSENFIKNNGRLGRSLGCPVLPPELNRTIIESIKAEPACLFTIQTKITSISRPH